MARENGKRAPKVARLNFAEASRRILDESEDDSEPEDGREELS